MEVAIHDIDQVSIRQVDQFVLPNGLKVHHIHCMSEQPLILESVTPAGRIWENQKSIAYATNQLIKEGTTMYTGDEIQELLDYYGSHLAVNVGTDMASIRLKTLSKHLDFVFPIFQSVLVSPVMPQKELSLFKRNKKQELIYDMQSSDIVAFRALSKAIFGNNHPYGYSSTISDYDAITRNQLIKFHKRCYQLGKIEFIVSSNNGEVLKKLSDLDVPKVNKIRKKNSELIDSEPQEIEIRLPNKSQSIILLGCRIPNKSHSDYAGIYILNTILGGYFGSRLIAELREKRGLAYHVYSSIDCMHTGALLSIGMETSKRNRRKSLNGVMQIIDRLIEEPISTDELRMTKNYLMGQIMGNLDGPVRVANLLKSLIFEGTDLTYITALTREIKNITPDKIRNLAIEYLNPNKLTKVIVH